MTSELRRCYERVYCKFLDGAGTGIACVWFLSIYTPEMPEGIYEYLSLGVCFPLRDLNRVKCFRPYRRSTILSHLTKTGSGIKVTPSYVLSKGCYKL